MAVTPEMFKKDLEYRLNNLGKNERQLYGDEAVSYIGNAARTDLAAGEREEGKPFEDTESAMNPAIQAVAGVGMAAEFLAKELPNPLSVTKNLWENMKQTDALKIYLQSKPEKLAEIKNISVKTGLPEVAITDDNIDDARKVYNERVKLEALTPLGDKEFDLNKLYESFPALKGLDNANDIAIALHNIENVKETHSIFEAGNVGLERGILSREISNIGKKYIYGDKSEISQEDLTKVQELENKISEMKRLPGLFEDPLEAIVGSTLEQSYRYGPGLLKGAAMGGASAAAGALAGGAVTGTAGAVKGAQLGWQWGLKLGLGSDMFNEIAGSKFLEYSQLKNKEGEALLSFNDAVAFAAMEASVETGIEFWNYDSIMNVLADTNLNVLAGTQHKRALKNIIASSNGKEEILGGIKRYLANSLNGGIEVAKGEIAEEMLQDVNEKAWMNSILSANPNNNYKKSDAGDMLKGATEAGMEALPSVIGMGAMVGGGSTISGIRAVARMSKVREEYGLGQLRNVLGTNMLAQLRQNMEGNDLYKKSPEVYDAVVTEEMKSTPYKTVYVDTELAQQNEETKEVYKQLAQASGYNEEEVAAAIDNKVPLAVPSQIYNKIVAKTGIDTTDELISFSATDDCLKRKNEAAKILDAELSAIVTKNAEQQAKLLESFINENFPEEDEARALATEIILQNPNAPSKGWADMRKEVQHVIDAKLSDVYALMAKDAPAQKVIEVGGDNKGVQVSEQANWYNNWHKANGRVPSKEDMEKIAYDIFAGMGDKYGYADAMPKTVEDQEAVKLMKAEIDADLAKRARLDEIKPQMEKMTETEITRVQNLSPEGYAVYSKLIGIFAGAENKKVVRQQREGAIMMAYVADNYARIRSEATGEQYTAQDYLKDKFGLDVNAKDVTSEGYNQSAMREENKRFVLNSSGGMDWGYVKEAIADDGTKIKAAPIRLQIGYQVGTNTAGAGLVHFFNKHRGLFSNDISNIEVVFNEIVNNIEFILKEEKDGIERLIFNVALDGKYVKAVLELDTDTSTHENFYTVITISEQKEKRFIANKKKALTFEGREVSSIATGDNAQRTVARSENSGSPTGLLPKKVSAFGTVSLSDVDEYVKKYTYEGYNQPQKVSFYEVQAIKKRSAVALAANERLATYASSISIRDALADVKDRGGISYINADGSGNFKLYNQAAYHGSPQSFDKFDLGAVGTGQGAQVHGWGLYFTKNKKVANEYKERLNWRKYKEDSLEFDEEKLTAEYEKLERSIAKLPKAERNKAYEKLSVLEQVLTDHNTENISEFSDEAVEWFNKNIKEKVLNKKRKTGALFEVDVPEDDVLLDEQKPLSEQPQKVREAIYEYMKQHQDDYILPKSVNDLGLMTGGNFYADVALNERKGGSEGDGNREASKTLSKLGIKGIAYEDKTDGRCFVVFDDKAVSIINRYNQDYKMAVLGAEQLHQDIQAWDKLVDTYENSDKADWKKKNNGALYEFMKVPLVMQLVGVDYNDIKIYGSFFEHSVRAKHPGMTLDIVKQLPQAMVDPIMIVKGNKPNSYVFVLEVVDNNGATVVVPVEITKQDRLYGVINVANTAFGRVEQSDNKTPSYRWFINSMKNDDVLYINNKKSTSWVQSIRRGTPVGTELNSAFLKLIISNTDGHVKTDADLDRIKMQYLELYQNTQGIQGQIAIAENGKRIISLFKSADESTFIHEMSHMALADLKELAALENVAEQVKKDWATVKEWASFEAGKSELYKDTPWEKEFRKLEEEIKACEQSGDTAEANRLKDVFLQERFARGFESYLKSGKAPTSALRSVFRQFKKWLTKIYKDFIGTGAMPSEAVREVMDRLVATQENIEQEGRLAELHSLRKNKVFNEVDKSTAVMYERWQKEAREEAEERVLSKALREAGSALQKEQKEALKQFRDEERARLIKENKVFTAEEFLKRAGGDMSVLPVLHYTAESYAKELKKAGGSLEEVLAKAVEQKKQELGEVTEEKIAERAKEAFQTSEYRNRVLGLELEALKRKKEFADKSNTKIIKKLEELKVINEKIEKSNTAEEKEVVEGEKRAKLADLRFSKDWSPKEERLLKNGEVEALKNIISSRQEHLKVLRDEAVKNVEVYKALAEKELARLPLSEATATRLWINKEKRAGQRVQTALVAGKWDEAMQSKKEQLMYSTLAWKSVELKEKVLAKTRVLANKAKVIAKPKSKMPVSERYLFQHALYVFGITRSDVPIPLGGKESLISMLSRYNDEFEHGFTTNEDNGGVPLWLLNALDDSKIYAKGKTEGYQALNIGQFEDLTNILTMIYTVGRESGNLRTVQDDAGNVVDVKEAVENIVGNIQQNIIAPINHDRTGLTLPDYMSKAIKYVGDEVRGYIKAESIFDQIDGGQENGFAMRYLYNPIQKSRNAEMVEHEKLSKEFQGLVKAHYDSAAWSKMFSDKVYELGTSQLTKEQVISIALNCGTTINTKRILDGYGVTWRQIEKLLSNLNGDDWGFVTGVWKMMGSYWEDTVKLEERLTGVTLEKQEAVPFTIKSKDGDIYRISGGYYPIVYDTTKSIRAANNKNDDMARTGMSGNAILETNLGFIKSRVTGKVNMPILLGFDIIGRALDSVVHNLCFREAVRDTNKLLNDRNITGALREYYGEETGNKLVRNLQQWARDNWVEDVKTGWYDKSIKFMRTNTTMAIMGYRVTTAVLNVLNIANIEEHIGAGRAALAVKDYYSEPLKNWKFVTSKSVFLRQRATTMDRDIREVLAKTKYSGNQVTDFIKREQFSVIAMTDNMLAQPLWLTEYKRVYREGIGKKLAPEVVERMAIDAGDQAVRRVFGSGDIKDLAPAQKGSEVTKMLTMFWSYANTVFNALVRSYNTGDRYRFIRSLLYLCLKTSIGEAFIRAALAGGDDDEPWYEKAVKRIPSTLWSQIFGFSPVLRILGEPAGKVVFDEKGYNNKTTAAFGTYDRWDVVMGTIKSMDGEKSKKDWLDLAQEAVKFTNSLTGLSDTITDGVFTTMRYWDNDFDNDFTEYLRAVMLDKQLKKSKKSV